jgi:ABC-type transporter Mla subunit MlaD
VGLFDKVKGLAGKHADKVEDAIDKVADVVDDKTGGKYADQIDKGAEAAKGLVGDDGEDAAVGDDGEPQP